MDSVKEPRWIIVLKLLGGGLMTLAAIVPIVFMLWPTMQPEKPPAQLMAEIDELKFVPNVSLRRYLQREEIAVEPYSADQLELAGHLLRFTVTTHGLQQRKLPSRWSFVDAHTQEQLTEFGEQLGPVFTPEAAVDRANTDIWIPPFEYDGSYFVCLELFDDKGIRLDSKDSPPVPRRAAVRLTRLPPVTQ